MLTATELTKMRETAAAALSGTAIIQSGTFVSDGGGGGSYGWASAGTYDCRLAPLNGNETERAGRISSEADYILTLPFDAAVTTDSRVVTNGGTYNVAAIHDRSWNVSTRVEVVKQTP